jgi:hypothetical protein
LLLEEHRLRKEPITPLQDLLKSKAGNESLGLIADNRPHNNITAVFLGKFAHILSLGTLMNGHYEIVIWHVK